MKRSLMSIVLRLVSGLFSGFVLLALTVGCSSAPEGQHSFSDMGYPPKWFAAVEDPKAPGWEILPQAAGPGEVILSKRGELGILSNFAATPFEFEGEKYPGVEGLWQAMKYPEGPKDPRAQHPGLTWKYTRAQVAQMTGFQAKRAGKLASQNMKKMGINWVTFKGRRMTYRTPDQGEHYRLIKKILWQKVEQNPKVQRLLLATGDLKLRPDHKERPPIPPAWRYYDIYTEIRTVLQARRR